MTILVDIDGVIFNTQETLLGWLNEDFHTNYTIEDITSYDWFDKTFADPWEPMEYEPFWQDVEINKQAVDYIIKWKNEGHTIKFVTASYYHHALPTKIHKLLDYFKGEFDDKDVIICHDKNMIKGDILIDDCVDNVKKFCMITNQWSILYLQPWNVHQFLNEDYVDRMMSCDSWDGWDGIDAYIRYINKNLQK